VALGLAIGLMPFIDVPEIDPEWILVGVLPPLLYAAAVRLPAGRCRARTRRPAAEARRTGPARAR
jgi:NhaP-type Na+/H+ or K+/H+ antiporter